MRSHLKVFLATLISIIFAIIGAFLVDINEERDICDKNPLYTALGFGCINISTFLLMPLILIAIVPSYVRTVIDEIGNAKVSPF